MQNSSTESTGCVQFGMQRARIQGNLILVLLRLRNSLIVHRCFSNVTDALVAVLAALTASLLPFYIPLDLPAPIEKQLRIAPALAVVVGQQ